MLRLASRNWPLYCWEFLLQLCVEKKVFPLSSKDDFFLVALLAALLPDLDLL